MKTILDIITPDNILQEQEKFFASKTYNPQFTYNWEKKEIVEFIKKRPYYERFIKCILAQNTDELVHEAKKVFQTRIDTNTLHLANSIINNIPDSKHNATPSIEEIIPKFKEALDILQLRYKVLVTDQKGFNFRPRYAHKIILMNKDTKFQFFSLDGEIKHEITHIIRYENSKYNKVEKSTNYLPTEEGLATYMQDYHGEDGESALFQYAAEYSVTEVGLHGSLRDMFNYLCGIGFSQELAWQRAIRHKFGFSDTAEPGDIMKPSMYFYTEQKIRELPLDDVLKLFIGKISLGDIQKVGEYSGIIPKNTLIHFYNLFSYK